MKDVSRRRFLQASSGAALGVSLGAAAVAAAQNRVQIAANSGPGKATANEKIVIGVIGCGGRGMYDAEVFASNPDVSIAAVCDVYEPHLERAKEKFKAEGYKDFRKLLERNDLDAVLVTTPPHWHAYITIMACQAGKDVYCEKPMALSPGEGRAMVKAARMNNRVTQIGTQIHAGENYHRAVEIARSGILGPISCVRTQLTLNESPRGPLKDATFGDAPANLDWDMWCGPIPVQPFSMGMFNGGCHRYFKATIGSWLHEMGPHIVDLAFWAMEPGEPLAATAMGGRYVCQDIGTIPDTMEVAWEFPGFMMTWSNMCGNSHGLTFKKPDDEGKDARRLGVSFHGEYGTLGANYDEWWLQGEKGPLDETKIPEPYLKRSPGHDREFLDSIKSRELPSCDVEHHLPLATALNLGNIAMTVGRRVQWDAAKGEIVGDAEANALANPTYRAPWVLPV